MAIYYAQKRKIAKMLRDGYLHHTICVAVGVKMEELCWLIDKEKNLKQARNEGYHWRQEHRPDEWPDFVMNGYLIGKKSEWWDQLPFAERVRVDGHPMTLIGSSLSLNLSKNKQRI